MNELTKVLELVLKEIAHKGHHGLHTYNSPRATSVDRVAREIGSRHGDCKACIILNELEEEGIVEIDDSGQVKVLFA